MDSVTKNSTNITDPLLPIELPTPKSSSPSLHIDDAGNTYIILHNTQSRAQLPIGAELHLAKELAEEKIKEEHAPFQFELGGIHVDRWIGRMENMAPLKAHWRVKANVNLHRNIKPPLPKWTVPLDVKYWRKRRRVNESIEFMRDDPDITMLQYDELYGLPPGHFFMARFFAVMSELRQDPYVRH